MEKLSLFLTGLTVAIGFITGSIYLIDFKDKFKLLGILTVLIFSNIGVLSVESHHLIIFELISIISFLGILLILRSLNAFRILLVVEVMYFCLLVLGRHFLHESLEGYVCLMAAFMIKLAVFPVVLWLPLLVKNMDALTSALLICLFEIVDFTLLLKVCFSLEKFYFREFIGIKQVLLYTGILTMLTGALLALSEENLRKLLAYATIDDTGYLIFSLGIFTSSSLSGAVILWINHVVSKFGLFLLVYLIEKHLKRENLRDLGGLFKVYPDLAFSFLVFALTLIGVPPFPGFWGKLFIYQEAFHHLNLGLVMSILLSSSLTLIYFIRAYHRIFLGELAIGQPVLFKDFSRKVVFLISLTILVGLLMMWKIDVFKEIF